MGVGGGPHRRGSGPSRASSEGSRYEPWRSPRAPRTPRRLQSFLLQLKGRDRRADAREARLGTSRERPDPLARGEAVHFGHADVEKSAVGALPHWLPLVTRATVPPFLLGLSDIVFRLMSKERLFPERAMLAISSVMSFTLGLVLIERMMTAKGGVVVPIEQLRVVKEMLPDLPRGTYSEVAATAAAFIAGASMVSSMRAFGRSSWGSSFTASGQRLPYGGACTARLQSDRTCDMYSAGLPLGARICSGASVHLPALKRRSRWFTPLLRST